MHRLLCPPPTCIVQLLVEERMCLPRLATKLVEFHLRLSQIGIDIGPVSQIVGNGAVDLFEGEGLKTIDNAFWRQALQEGVDDGVQRDAGTSNPVSTVALFNIML
jgi:hypothetical protein